MRAPRFARDLSHLKELLRDAKEWECPNCLRPERLNLHGPLRGCAEVGPDKAAVRGWRLLCSNRGQRGGCGGSFSILLSEVIARATVRSGELWRFYLGKLSGKSVLAAWEGCRSRFSVEAAYGWWRRFRRGEITLREILSRGRGPPEGDMAAAVSAAFGADDPIGGFQIAEQRGWPS